MATDINPIKKLIIAELDYMEDEWLLTATKRLLGLAVEAKVPEQHKQVLHNHVNLSTANTSPFNELGWGKKIA